MKKLFILLIILGTGLSLLTGCKSEEISEKNIESASIPEAPGENEIPSAKDLIYEKDGYLWHGSKKLLENTIAEWLGGENYNAGIWFQRHEDNQMYGYFSSGADCGGCFIMEDDYMIIDKTNNKITRKVLDITDNNNNIHTLFTTGNGAYVLSPDKTKVAFVSTNDFFDGDQSIYIYDFKTEKSEKFMDLEPGQKIAELGPGGFFLYDQNLYWDEETGKLIVSLSRP